MLSINPINLNVNSSKQSFGRNADGLLAAGIAARRSLDINSSSVKKVSPERDSKTLSWSERLDISVWLDKVFPKKTTRTHLPKTADELDTYKALLSDREKDALGRLGQKSRQVNQVSSEGELDAEILKLLDVEPAPKIGMEVSPEITNFLASLGRVA